VWVYGGWGCAIDGEKYKYKYSREGENIHICIYIYRERDSAFYFPMVGGFTVWCTTTTSTPNPHPATSVNALWSPDI